MTDTRFTTAFESVADLIDGIDVDGIEDLETLLMVVLARPVGVTQADEDEEALDVLVSGDQYSTGTTYEFPLSVIDLVRSCAETAEELGPYTTGGEREAPASTTRSDPDLIEVLQRGLGQVRLFNMLDDD